MVRLFIPGRFVQSQARMLTAPFEPSEPFVSLLSIDVDPLRAREAGAFAVEMVEWMEAAHGHRYHAATNLAGDGLRVHWIGEFSDLDTMAATNDRITADDEYWERGAKAAEYFKGYSSRRVQLHRRLA